MRTWYEAVSANVIISVQKLDESGQMVLKVKWAYFDAYLSQTM